MESLGWATSSTNTSALLASECTRHWVLWEQRPWLEGAMEMMMRILRQTSSPGGQSCMLAWINLKCLSSLR